MSSPLVLRRLGALMLIFTLLRGMAWAAGVQARRESYRGWTNAVILSNGSVEAVIVPEVGRILQFRFVGASDGPFWENDALAGKPMPARPWDVSHGSFGGDKTWPAPQSAWNWPPPDVFDSVPLEVEIAPDQSVSLRSPVSPRFGIRTQRRIVISPDAPVLRVETVYRKRSGDPCEVGVWVITQMKSPEAAFFPVPASSRFPKGLGPQWTPPARHFSLEKGLVRLTRDPVKAQKIGNDADRMAWVGRDSVVRIDLPRVRGGNYPDEGCSVEIYTNPDPVPYVELETLGPLMKMKPGDGLSATNYYRLERRHLPNPEAEARRILAEPPPYQR